MIFQRSLVLGFVLAGCLSACGLFSSNLHPIPELKEVVGLKKLQPRWKISLGGEDLVPLSPAVAHDHVYAARGNGEVFAYTAASGAQTWRKDLRVSLTAGVGAADGYVALGTKQGLVILLDEDGKEIWRQSAGNSEISASPVISGGMVVVRTGDGSLVAFNVIDGKRRWKLDRALPALTLYHASNAVAVRGAIFAGYPGGKLLAIGLDQGRIGWEAAVAIPRGATELERVADVTGAPQVSDRNVCAATFQGRIACFETTNGNPIWSRDASSIAGLGADTSRVYVADDKGVVNAWERASGASAWKNEDFLGRRLVGATAASGQVVVTDLQGYVHWLDRIDGKVIARASTDDSSAVQTPLFLGDGVLVQTRKGGLYAFPMP
jgi:outer membrane protein assembly factor BamB